MPEVDARTNQNKLYMALRFLEDCISFYWKMHDLPTCNECGKRKDCEYVPRWGERVRYNCPHFEAEGKEDANGA